MNDTSSHVYVNDTWNGSEPFKTEHLANIMNGTFYWSVLAFDNASLSAQYPVWKFNISIVPPPPPPPPPPPNDTVKPNAVSEYPTGTSVPITSPIVIEFSERMRPDSVKGAFSLVDGSGRKVQTVLQNGTGTVFTFVPVNGLNHSTNYTAKISQGAMDLAGNPLNSSIEWSFRTVPAKPPPGGNNNNQTPNPKPYALTTNDYIGIGLVVACAVAVVIVLLYFSHARRKRP